MKGKVALVTGGSRGIGRDVVLDLATKGARVFFTYQKSEDAAKEVEQLVSELGFEAMGIECDSRDTDQVTQTVDHVVKEGGAVDILILNAGITRDQYLMLMSDEEFESVIDTNLTGAYRFAKAVSRNMMARKTGAIVTIASVAALFGIPGQANYCASKGGLVAFTRALAAELAPKGIRVNAVLPGFIDTDMTARMPRRVKMESKEKILLNRFGTTKEVAEVVSFLVSDAASYVIGQAIVVDGGLTSTVA